MTVFNQGWISFGGAPVTGRVPTALRVHSLLALTPLQQGATVHAYKLFCDVVRASPHSDGYHVQHRTLPDGSQVQMTANGGVHVVDVWPASIGGEPPELARGFAVRPIWANGVEATWPDKSTLVKYDTTNSKWVKWVSPYRIGKDARPNFFLDPTKRTKSKRAALKAETHFADVYSLVPTGALYLNSLPHKGLGAGTHGMPVLVRDAAVPTPHSAWFVIDSAKIAHAAESPTETTRVTVFDRDASFGPTVGSSLEYNAGARYTESAKRADYLRVLITASGAMQTWRASIALLPQAPWVSSVGSVFQQMNAPTSLAYRGGYMTASSYIPEDPFVPLRDNNAMYIGSGVYASKKRAIYERSRNTIDAALSDSGSVGLYPDMTGAVTRNVSISATLVQGQGLWMGEWPTNKPGVWCALSIPTIDEYGLYGSYKTPFDGPNAPGIFSGALVTSVLTEIGGKITVSDQATSATTAGTLTIFSSAVQHEFITTKAEAYEHGSVPWDGGHNPNVPVYSYPFFEPIHCIGDTCYGGLVSHYASTGWAEQVFVSKVPPNQGNLTVRENESYSVQASAKDYIYYDAENNVALYVESTLAGTYTFESEFVTLGNNSPTSSDTQAGSMEVTIHLKLDAPQGSKQVLVHTASFSFAPKVNLVFPEDLPQNTDFTWRHVDPGVAPPIFTPTWFNQGGCPHIAYTTQAEAASAAIHEPPLDFVHRLVASFRLRMLFRARPQFAEIVDVPHASTVYLPMLEAMLIAHFPGLFYYAFAGLEATPFILNASFPDGVLTDIGLPAADTFAEVYRT